MKDNRGEITIMMVITGIVLIILGGICIFMLTGEDGFFVPRRDVVENETVENNNTLNNNETNENNTVDTNQTQDENQTDNDEGALRVPMQ